MKHYKRWENDFPDKYDCRHVLDSVCPGSWIDGGFRTDFICNTCGRRLDTKYGGETRGKQLTQFVSQVPYDEHYDSGTIIAVRTKDGDEYAFYKGDSWIAKSGKPSVRGTKEYGSTPWYLVATDTFSSLFEKQFSFLGGSDG